MASNPHRWRILAVVATAFFMTILDVSIVNVALPSIGRSLDFSREKWRERLIEGNATFTIETSRMVMKKAVATTARILQRCGFEVMTRLG